KKAFEILKKNLAIHQSVINEFRGRLIKEMGDGMLASFSTVSDALNASIQIQKHCNETSDYKLSIGIHQGEVVFQNGDVFGDAVNVASRIQSLGISGSVLISKKIADEIKNKSEFTTSSLGSFEFKNVNEPIEIFALTNQGLTVPRKSQLQGKLKKGKQKRNLVVAVSIIFLLISTSLVYYNFFSNKRVIRKRITANPVAYEWYTRAEYRITPESPVDLDSAIFFLTKAIEADSTFALAHAELSRAYSIKNYFIDPKGGYNEKAFVEAEKSLYLNPDLAEGIFARAYLNWNFQNKFPHEKTIREYKKAIALNPGMDEAYHQLGVVYLHIGLMDESVAAIKKSLEINPNNKFAAVDVSSGYFFTGHLVDFQRMIELFKATPDQLMSPFRNSQWGAGLIALGQLEDAHKILEAGLKKDSSNLFINSAYAILLATEGDKEGALKKIEFCEKSNLNTGHYHHAVYYLAAAYSILGESEKAVNKLNWVAENGLPNYIYFRDDPLLESLHAYEPYKKLLEELEVSWNKFKLIASE
ncbi:MAG TPA: adenylate/guanylate cyclase domain-containing protein, partial [Cyclobacteriaceae bacterium]|nr:adenylate/guanylate cyclase domain-containing protein [Cyclobacteriaceae bacterium]